MAKLEHVFTGRGIAELVDLITEGILSRSMSASLEDSSSFSSGDVSCVVLVFERYSIIGSNRLSLTVTLFSEPGRVRVSGISSGGSEGIMWKINTFGEEAFLDVFSDVLSSIS
ncbi:MAG TPA: DUF6054 family protein [Atopobiaceae bacterium]|nr:DUF6054 family protein [Atopobiaceae bacterium]